MPSSLKFVLGLLLLAAICTPLSIMVPHAQEQKESRLLADLATGGRSAVGATTVRRLGCGACHQIGMTAATGGQVGPTLNGLSARAEIGGKLSSDPRSLIAWIQHPQTISPGVGMPDIPMSDQDARDMAAYLYTLRIS